MLAAASRKYYYLAFFATCLALIVVMLGAYTRLSDAGLGCPDWPGCYGHLTVPESTAALQTVQSNFPGQIVEPAKAWKEMVHRYFAGTLGTLIVILAFWSLFSRKNIKKPIIIPIVLVGLVVFQAALGMWTVTWKVLPLIVSAHLLGGIAIAALLWYLTLSVNPSQIQKLSAAKIKPWAILGLMIVILQLFLGAWTSTNYAALACTDFPFCHGTLIPPETLNKAFNFWQPIGINYEGGVLDSNTRITIQLMHRYGAALTTVFVGLLGIFLLFTRAELKLRNIGLILLVLLSVQVLLGIANIVMLLPLPIAVAHNGVAALLLLAMITLLYKTNRKTSA